MLGYDVTLHSVRKIKYRLLRDNERQGVTLVYADNYCKNVSDILPNQSFKYWDHWYGPKITLKYGDNWSVFHDLDALSASKSVSFGMVLPLLGFKGCFATITIYK